MHAFKWRGNLFSRGGYTDSTYLVLLSLNSYLEGGKFKNSMRGLIFWYSTKIPAFSTVGGSLIKMVFFFFSFGGLFLKIWHSIRWWSLDHLKIITWPLEHSFYCVRGYGIFNSSEIHCFTKTRMKDSWYIWRNICSEYHHANRTGNSLLNKNIN